MHDQAEQWAVLVVDDEPQILSAVEDLLEDHFIVHIAESAQRALQLLGEHPVSVIISDQRMPGMTGDEFLARARAHSAAARILLTGYADFSAVVRAVNDGQIYAYLTKPWDPEQLRLTVRRAAEHAALQQELDDERRLLRLLMENVPDGIYFKDAQLRYLRANQVVAECLQVAGPQMLTGGTAREFMDADLADAVDAEDRAVLDGSRTVADSVRALPQGRAEARWFSLTKFPMVNEQGAVEGLIGIARDVHDRHLAEGRVRESEQRFRDFVDTASDWFWEMDSQLRFSSLSENFERALRQSASDLLGKRRGESGFVEAEGHSMAGHRADLEARRAFRNFVYGRILPDGSVVWASISGKPRFDASGRFLGYRGTGRDVTAEREALMRLADSERRVRLLLDSAAEGIYGVDVRGRCSFVNPAALKALGYQRAEDLLGRSLHELIHHTREDGSPYPREECPLAAAMGMRQVVRLQEELLWRADGSSFYAQISMHPVVADGEMNGAVVSFTDITDLRRSQSAVMLVNRIAVALGQAADMEAALEIALRLACEDAHWRFGEAWMPDADGHVLSLAAVSHDPDPQLEQFVVASEEKTFRRGHGLPGRVWESHQPEWLPEPGEMPASAFERAAQIRATDLHGACAIPVQDNGDVVAVLVFYSRSASEEDNLRVEALTAALAPLGAFLKRITMQDAMRETERRLNLALDSAKVGTWDWHLATGALRWDAYMPPLFGVAADAVPTDFDAFAELVHPSDREALLAACQATFDEHRDLNTEFRVVRANDGEVRCIAARGRVVTDEDGALLALTGVNWDVTDEREAQAEVEDLARFYLDNPQPVLRIAADGRVLLSNPASAALCESWTRDGETSAPPELVALLPQALGSGDVTICELNVGERVLRLTLVPVLRHGYMNVYSEDITVQRETAERMRQAQKMEAVGQLTGGIAHDFNNRLTVISGNLELVELQLPADSPCVKLLGHARRATDGAAKLTRQLLTFARRQIEEPEPVDVNQHIEALEEMIGRSLGETISLELNLCASPWPVFTDSGQLEDALLNLCVNARDAMPDGGRVTIESENLHLDAQDTVNRPYLQRGDYVMIAVTDTGCGIPADALDRIFEPFFTTKAVGKGTGLGLSMVYGFAKQSGGFLHAYSEVGHGTCFKMYLPCRERHEEADRANATESPALAGGQHGRILLVEDDQGVRDVATAMLISLGYTVEVAEHGPAALALLERDAAFDLLLTDVVMPEGMNGFELSRAVRERWPEVRLLFSSGYSDRGPFKDAMEQANVDWVVKPYTHAKLASRVREVLARDADQAGTMPALSPTNSPNSSVSRGS